MTKRASDPAGMISLRETPGSSSGRTPAAANRSSTGLSRRDLALAEGAQRRQVLAIDGVVERGGEPRRGACSARECREIAGATHRDPGFLKAQRVERGSGEPENFGIGFRSGCADQLAAGLQPLINRTTFEPPHDAAAIVEPQRRD